MNNLIQNVKLIAFDVDGVLTDGTITYSENGYESKNFNAKDGQGITMLTKAGFSVAIITARTSSIVQKRATELGIQYIYQNAKNKLAALDEIIEQMNITYEQVAYMGDDLPDIPVLEKVGIKACPLDAVNDVRKICNFISKKDGGKGAARELTDIIYEAFRLKVGKNHVDLPPIK